MLARYLRTSQQPVRYAAMDPAHLQAIQNYLMLATRGHDIPGLHAGSMDQLGPVYQRAPHAHGAMQSLLESGHPGDLMVYLDALQDQGFEPNPMQGDSHRLLHTLAALHGHLQPGHPLHPRIVRGFTDEGLAHPRIANAILQSGLQSVVPGTNATRGDFLGRLTAAHHHASLNDLGYRAHDAGWAYQKLLEQLRATGNPSSVVPLHDTAAMVADRTPRGSHIHNQAIGSTNEVRNLIQGTVMHHLLQGGV